MDAGYLTGMRTAAASAAATRLMANPDASSLALIGELAAGVAHELGNPVGIIRSTAEYIRGRSTQGFEYADEYFRDRPVNNPFFYNAFRRCRWGCPMSPDIPETTKARLRAEHAELEPFELKKSIEAKLKKFFTALGNLNGETAKLQRVPSSVTFCRESTRQRNSSGGLQSALRQLMLAPPAKPPVGARRRAEESWRMRARNRHSRVKRAT